MNGTMVWQAVCCLSHNRRLFLVVGARQPHHVVSDALFLAHRWLCILKRRPKQQRPKCSMQTARCWRCLLRKVQLVYLYFLATQQKSDTQLSLEMGFPVTRFSLSLNDPLSISITHSNHVLCRRAAQHCCRPCQRCDRLRSKGAMANRTARAGARGAGSIAIACGRLTYIYACTLSMVPYIHT